MKDEELKLEEIESSLTLGGLGEVTRGEGRGEGVDATLLSYILRYINLSVYDIRDSALHTDDQIKTTRVGDRKHEIVTVIGIVGVMKD